MLTLRLYGGSHVTSWPWSSMRPDVGCFEAADHPEGRGLAAARRAEEAEELAVLDLEVDVVDRDLVAELLDDIDEADVDLRQLALSVGTGRNRRLRWRLGDRGTAERTVLHRPSRQAEDRCARSGVSRTRGPHERCGIPCDSPRDKLNDRRESHGAGAPRPPTTRTPPASRAREISSTARSGGPG